MDQAGVLALGTFLFATVIAQPEVQVVTMPNMDVCPPNATCADYWDLIRRREGEDPYRERRFIQRCVCENTGSCPTTEEFMLSQSRKHKEVLCEPVRQHFRRCRPGMTARVYHPNSARNNGKSFFEIRCLCPLHFRPGRGRTKATKQTGTRYDPIGFTYTQMYECNWGGRRRRPGRRGRNRRRNRNRNNRQ